MEAATGAQAIGNAHSGFLVQQGSGFYAGGQIYARYNGINGIDVEQSTLGWLDLLADYNGAEGLIAIASQVMLNSTSFTGNVNYAVANDGSIMRIQYMAAYNNGVGVTYSGNGGCTTLFSYLGGSGNGNLVTCSNGSHVRVPPGIPFTYSPAIGVEGNNHSMIYS